MEKHNVSVINSKLPGFVLLDAITEEGKENIRGASHFSNALPWLCVECLAQLGAFHVRFLTGFDKHIFLLKMNRCIILSEGILDGLYLLNGTLVSRSSAAFSYDLEARKGKELEIAGNFLYAAVDYDDNFKREKLRERYFEVYKCLKSATGKDSSKGEKPDFSEPHPQ
jgi:hypothetical protein